MASLIGAAAAAAAEAVQTPQQSALENPVVLRAIAQHLTGNNLLAFREVSRSAHEIASCQQPALAISEADLDRFTPLARQYNAGSPSIKLNLIGATKDTLEKLSDLFTACPEFAAKVIELNFARSKGLTNMILAGILGKTPNLKKLWLGLTNVTHISPELRLLKLAEINLRANFAFTDAAKADLRNIAPNLLSIGIPYQR